MELLLANLLLLFSLILPSKFFNIFIYSKESILGLYCFFIFSSKKRLFILGETVLLDLT